MEFLTRYNTFASNASRKVPFGLTSVVQWYIHGLFYAVPIFVVKDAIHGGLGGNTFVQWAESGTKPLGWSTKIGYMGISVGTGAMFGLGEGLVYPLSILKILVKLVK